MNAITRALARLLAWRRGHLTLTLVDHMPLHAGAAIHVIDVDGRRLVVATSPNAIRLLAQYERPLQHAPREEAPRPRV